MGNIRNFNFNDVELKLSNSDYWDFFLTKDDYNNETNIDCAVVWYDFNNLSTFINSAVTGTTIYSLKTWDKAINTGYTIPTVGLTGIDNGLIIYNKNQSDYSNLGLLSALTGTTLIIDSGDTRMIMNKVSGSTGEFIYPIKYIVDPDLNMGYEQLCGGFFQGYYKIDGTNYEVLPVRVNQAWAAEFWLNPQDLCSVTTGTTLNDVYPNNKGFFFYMGTRAENKFWNQFYGNDTGCTSGCTTSSACTGTVSTFCTTVKEKDVTIVSDYGFGVSLSPPRSNFELIINQFLIYGRAYDNRSDKLSGNTGSIIINGLTHTDLANNINNNNSYSNDGLGTKTIYTYDNNGIAIERTKKVISDFRNPFLIYGRSYNTSDDNGKNTVNYYSGRTSPEEIIDYKSDIIDNALGFRIKDDGSIGYRLLTVTGSCYTSSNGSRLYQSGVTIHEEYSKPNMVNPNKWSYVVIRFVANHLDDCDFKVTKTRLGKLMFYVNARLKFVVNDFPEFIAKRLDENKTKQFGVPFNFSLGGGSQGLIDSLSFDGIDNEDRGLPIESNFAGTFIGGISQFKFNVCDLDFYKINNNYLNDINRYGIKHFNFILQEDEYYLLQENDYGLLL
jgi:hypothetical protein